MKSSIIIIILARAFQRMMATGSISKDEWLYWGAETTSEDGKKGRFKELLFCTVKTLTAC